MSQPPEESDVSQSTTSTKKSILIRPSTEQDLNDFIYINSYKAGRKFREALTRLSQRYNFSENEFKRNKIKITLDFAALQQLQQQQQEEKA